MKNKQNKFYFDVWTERYVVAFSNVLCWVSLRWPERRSTELKTAKFKHRKSKVSRFTNSNDESSCNLIRRSVLSFTDTKRMFHATLPARMKLAILGRRMSTINTGGGSRITEPVLIHMEMQTRWDGQGVRVCFQRVPRSIMNGCSEHFSWGADLSWREKLILTAGFHSPTGSVYCTYIRFFTLCLGTMMRQKKDGWLSHHWTEVQTQVPKYGTSVAGCKVLPNLR